MSRLFARWSAPLWLALALTTPLHAEEVTLPYQGLTLNGNLDLAQGKSLADGVILITHGTLAHNRMELIAALQERFHEQGYSTLAINLSLGQDNRHGMYDCATPHVHKHGDAVGEIGAWLEWLKSRSAGQVVLMGHSRGANQTALFAAEHADPAIKKVVLLAPDTWDAKQEAADYQARYHKPLSAALQKARAMAATDPGAMMEHIDFLYCPDSTVSAASFLSYYDNPRVDAPSLLPEIDEGTLVIAGSADSFEPDLPARIKANATPQVKLVVIDGADHFFRDLYTDEVVEAVGAFVQGQ
jgi:pimeloyl-ACP methyl ester carboxylesterase